jgi:hypothetical protein
VPKRAKKASCRNGIDICGHASNYLATVVHTRSSINMLTNDERKEILTKMKTWQPRMSVKKQAWGIIEYVRANCDCLNFA